MEKQRGIPNDEVRHIAHVIAEKSIRNIGPEQPIQSAKKYIETYNKVIKYIEEYNRELLVNK